jgi:DNA-binding Lrp family transcriptional regulator
MNPIDEKLLTLLRRNARLPLAALARRLGIPRSTVQYRIDRLERTGVIRGYTVVQSVQSAAAKVKAHVLIAIEPRRQDAVEKKLRAIPDVRSLLTVSGNYDLIAILAADSPHRLDEALDAVRTAPGVRKTVTAVVLSARIERGTDPLA